MNISAYFSVSGVPSTGLSPTITIYDVSDGSEDVSAAAMTEIASGFYTYAFSAIDISKEYVAICDSVTLTGSERYAVVGFSSLATESKQDTAQTDLDTITGADGVTLATLQPNYAPAALGAGAVTYAYTLTDDVTGNPIDGASVWVTTDSAGTDIIASGTTNDSGVVTFYLDAATRYFWRQRSGYTFSNPDTEVVS